MYRAYVNAYKSIDSEESEEVANVTYYIGNIYIGATF